MLPRDAPAPPRVICAMISLNLGGLFEIPTPRFVNQAGGAGGAFATGALAAFIATPCTGPFMGAALGAALILPWPAALAVFAGLGLGLALPFLALGFVPVTFLLIVILTMIRWQCLRFVIQRSAHI